MSARGHTEGFTLVELLVVLVLLGLIGVMSFDGLRLGARAWETVDDVQAVQAAQRRARTVIREAILSVMPLPEQSAGAGGGLQGDGKGIAFLARGAGGLNGQTFAVETADGRTALVHSRTDRGGQTVRETLLRDAEGLEFAYRADGMAPGRWSARWLPEWPLPDLITLREQTRENDDGVPSAKSRWPEEVVRIPVSHPSACLVQPVMLGCIR